VKYNQSVGNAMRQLEDARRQFESRRAELSRQEEQAQRNREEEEHLRLVEQNLSLECARVQQEVNSCATELSRLRDKMEARNSVSGEEECPTCGSILDEAARMRIEHEREHWAEEATHLGSESERLNRLLEEKTESLERARSELSTAVDAGLTSRLKVERSRSDLDHAAADVRRAEGTVKDARSSAGDWAAELKQLSALTEEFDGLADAPQDWNRLMEAQQIENSVQSVVKAHHKQLNRLPQWSAEERGQLRVAVEKLAQTVTDYTDEEVAVEATLEAARAERDKVEKEQLQIDVELRTERERATELTQRQRDAQARYENKQGELTPKWATDPACMDEAALSELKRKLEGLRGAEDEERELREARLREEGHKGSLEILQAQLGQIPSIHHREVAEVQLERDAAKTEARRADEELRATEEKRVKLEEQKRVADKRREEFIEAEREFGYFRLLAEAFGPSGLRARVVQSAQEMIKSHANTILGRLSNGEWQVELQDVSETELEIQARNVVQAGAQSRPFEYLSGGEKFRVAVSLAVAIGQSVLGERVVDTLVIDEGFGSLDEINRDLMAKEMSHLSEEVLRGGRVVIVSHLDDVRSDFGSRYRISKDSEGYIQVEQNGQD
jgi:DNA repair protein SbcC/Rad50